MVLQATQWPFVYVTSAVPVHHEVALGDAGKVVVDAIVRLDQDALPELCRKRITHELEVASLSGSISNASFLRNHIESGRMVSSGCPPDNLGTICSTMPTIVKDNVVALAKRATPTSAEFSTQLQQAVTAVAWQFFIKVEDMKISIKT